MTDVQSKQQHETGTVATGTGTTILDLPAELIVNICCSHVLNTMDIFNLALSHPKLNDCLFREQNSTLWKSKYIQRYGQLDEDEYKVLIDEQNTWKDEIMMRMSLDRAVTFEIKQMPGRYKMSKNVPYHLFPFSEELNSKNEGHRYYVLSACTRYYKSLRLWNDNYKKYNDILFMAHQFLNYSCQVYFSYKIDEFLNLPPTEQTYERGLYLMGRWWCPSEDISYRDTSKYLDDLAMNVCNYLQSTNPVHPLFENGNCLTQVTERGKTNLAHDLFDEANSLAILNAVRRVLFHRNHLVCYCNHDINCYILKQVIDRKKGSLYLTCVMFESIARRLGVKITLTATSVHNFITWTSSWPGTKKVNDTFCYLIDVTVGFHIRIANICPVTKKLPEHYENSLRVIFWEFGRAMEQLSTLSLSTLKYVLDFQYLIRPNSTEVEFKIKKFHEIYDYCRCPLIRNQSNSFAPHHADEKNNFYLDFEDIFPLLPRRRKAIDNPKHAVGMAVDCCAVGNHDSSNMVSVSGIIVGWSIHRFYKSSTVYYLLVNPDTNFTATTSETVVVQAVRERKDDELRRQLTPTYENFKSFGKFFKHFDYELGAFEPIDDLMKLYPDDMPYIQTIKHGS